MICGLMLCEFERQPAWRKTILATCRARIAALHQTDTLLSDTFKISVL